MYYLISETFDDSFFLLIRQSRSEIVIQNVNRFAKYSVSCKIYNDETSRSFEGKTVPLGTQKDSDLYKDNSLKIPSSLIENLEGQNDQLFYVDLKIES